MAIWPDTQSLQDGRDRLARQRADAGHIVASAIEAIEPGRLVERALNESTTGSGDVWVIAAGKAAPAMASAVLGRLDGRIRGGLVVSTTSVDLPCFECRVGGHPLPTVESERAGRRALALASEALPDDCVLVLLSGGASALLAVPAPGLTIDDKQKTTHILLRAGADIHALNTVRKHLSGIKGGRLAVSSEAALLTLAVSDVADDNLSVIGSGPTVHDPTTFADALDVLRRFAGLDAYPTAVAAHIARGISGSTDDTPKCDDARLSRSRTSIIAGRRHAMIGAAEQAVRLGYRVRVVDDPIIGEARFAGAAFVETHVVKDPEAGAPLCVIASGETTVRVNGSGRGGRNQEFALAAAEALASLRASATLVSVGTDGVDGVTDAAGAIVDSDTIARAEQQGLGSPRSFLDSNDTYAFFSASGDLIRTGPTGTNVGDVQVLIIG